MAAKAEMSGETEFVVLAKINLSSTLKLEPVILIGSTLTSIIPAPVDARAEKETKSRSITLSGLIFLSGPKSLTVTSIVLPLLKFVLLKQHLKSR